MAATRAFTPAQTERADRARGEARDSISAALNRIRGRWGGVDQYLLVNGLPRGRLDQLRSAFVG